MDVKILIIEDEENITKLLKVNLIGNGFKVDNASDGEEGLNKIETFNPDLIILDLRMPKINGWQILRKMKSDIKYNKIKVVVLTASDRKENKEQAISEGADGFFSKPVEVQAFIGEIKKLI